MSGIEKVKVTKGTITKEIQKKDLPIYINMGWRKATNFNDRPTRFDKV